MTTDFTTISPVVNVPVLLTQRSFKNALDWILSRFLIKMLSFFRFVIERDIAIDVTKGKPSGIETMSNTIAVITIFRTRIRESFENKSVLESHMTKTARKIRLVKILRMVAPREY